MSEPKVKAKRGRPVNHLLAAFRADPATTAAIIQRELERAVADRSGDVVKAAADQMGVSRASLERMFKEEGLRHLRSIRIKPTSEARAQGEVDGLDFEDLPVEDQQPPPPSPKPEPKERVPGSCFCGRPSLTPSGWCAKGYCEYAYKFGVTYT